MYVHSVQFKPLRALLCVMPGFSFVLAKSEPLAVCLCVSGWEPSLPLTPSGLCVGLSYQHYHLLVFYSGPRATMTAELS